MSGKKFSLKELWKDLGTRRWIFLLALGLLLVVAALPTKEGAGEKTEATESTVQQNDEMLSYEKQLEKRLEQILSQIEGAGRVEVMVTLKASSEQILQSDTSRQESRVRETDSAGGVRDNSDVSENSQTVLTGGTNGEPVVVKELMPQVEGVVVACEGGASLSVQAEISAAVQALFDVQPHKIKVCKMAS